MRARVLVAGPIAVVASLVLAASAYASGSTAVVTTASDSNSLVAPNCSLRDAIAAVTADGTVGGCVPTSPGGDDHVNFAAGMSGQTITLSQGAITINDLDDLDITGPGMNQLTVDAHGASRVLNVMSRTSITGLSLINGKAPEVSGAAEGGAIQDTAAVTFSLVLTDVKVAGSAAEATGPSSTEFADGGAIHAVTGAPVTLNRSVITGNHATATQNGGGTNSAEARGGAIFNEDDITITDSTISGNNATATTDGTGQGAATAGIRTDGHLEMSGSTLSGNAASATAATGTANARGALYVTGGTASDVEQSTIAGNTAAIPAAGTVGADTGGLDIANDTDIKSSTIALNGPASLSDGVDGANILVESGANSVENTIIADPRGVGRNCHGAGALTSNGFNDDFGPGGASCFPISGTDLASNPLLAAGGLGNNGGLTQTIALQPASPMIDQGTNAGLTNPNQDQRGASFPRPVDFSGLPNAAGGNGSDIGAFEVQQACPGFTQSTPTTPCPTGGGTSTTPLAVLGGSSGKLKGGTVGIPISCPAGGGACQGTVDLTTGQTLLAVNSKNTRIGSASFSIPAGQSQKVKVKLSKHAKKTVQKKGKLSAKATITTQGPGGPKTSTGKLKIKR